MNEIINPHNIFVGELKAAIGLSLQVAQDGLVVNQHFGQELERDIAFQVVIARQPDNSHSAATKSLNQCVTTKKLLPSG